MIYGERIRLRKNEKEDLPAFVRWINDPEVRVGIGMYLPISHAEEDHWFEDMLKRPPAERPFCIEIRDGGGWRLIGNTSLFDFDWRCRSAEFGILIGEKDVWNQGYGTQTTRLMLQHGFDTLNLHRITLRVYDNNPRARRAYEKAGYVHEGILRQDEFRDGKYVDVHVMSVLSDEWKNRNL